MANVVFTFGTLDLSSKIDDVWEETLHSRINPEFVPKRHGALVNDAGILEPRIFRATASIVESTQTNLRNTIESLRRDLKRQKRAKLSIYNDRFIHSYNHEFSYHFIPGSAMTAAFVQLGFFADDPFFYDPTYFPANTSVTLDASPKDLVVNLQGASAFMYPAIQIEAVGGNIVGPITIENTTAGAVRSFIYSGTILDGNVLEANFEAFTMKNNGVIDWNNFDGKFIVLDPESGTTNTIRYTGPTGAHVMTVYYKPRYY
jgi:hypothetical protein